MALAGCSSLDPASDTAAKFWSSSAGGGGAISSGGAPGSGGAAAFGGTSPDWACLGMPVAIASRTPDRVHYRVAIVDFDSQPPPNMPTAVEGLEITVCGSPSCNPPFTEPTVVIHNPIEGAPPYLFDIEFPYNFSNGSLRLTAPGYAPMDYVFGGPLNGPPEGGYVVMGQTIPLLKVTTRDTIYNDLGLPGPADPTRGVLAVRTLNCQRNMTGAQGQRAAGVRLHAIPEAPPAPAVAWTLSFSNRATPNKLETDARGVAGFVNVLPGTIDVEGIAPVGEGTPYGETALRVRAGVITLAEVRMGIDRFGQ
ncbi:MAG: hypothetical protein QM756_27270 [Polyangiaceae bacterium]